MPYRSLLVLLDADPLCAERVRVALQLAKRLECHVVGVAPTGLVDVPIGSGAAVLLLEVTALAWDSLRKQAEQATEAFCAACAAAGISSFETVVDESEKVASLLRHARCSDITVMSQVDPAAPDHRAAQRVVEQTVLQSARPTLLLPYAGYRGTLGRHAMVAWDDSREAARALSDALPLLRLAERVELVRWAESGLDDTAPLQQRLDAVQRWLMWQGVTAEVRIEATSSGIADAMLSRAADQGIDLIVMGAYGHSRWTERVLGGATRGLLRSMTVPVLMSH